VPFEIPDNWVWTTIGELLINRDSERIPLSTAVREKQTNKIYDYYGAAGVIDKVDNYIFSERLLLIGEDGANLLSRSKDNAFFADGKYWVNNHAHVLDCTNKIALDFVAFVINAFSLDMYITGSAQPKLSQDNLNKILIPLPPLDEQRRLIEAKNEWFAIIDELELNKQDLQEIVKQTKSKVLDLAIHGKLVPQDPNDEPAMELLKRINPATKPCDTSHYGNLPKGWCATTFEYLSTNIASKKYQIKQSEINESGKYPVISQSANFIEGYSDVDSKLLHMPSPIIVFGDHTRITKYIDFDFIVGADGVKILQPLISARYFYYLTQYVAKKIENRGYSRHYSYLSRYIVPLPPRVEQERIALRIEELFDVLDKISADL
jgi:type I restriction enzyme S subunit